LDANRIALIYGGVNYTLEAPANYESYSNSTILESRLLASTALKCKPTYHLESLEVTRNGTKTKHVSILKGASRRVLNSVHAWDITNALLTLFYKAIADSEAFGRAIQVGNTEVLTNRPAELLYQTEDLAASNDRGILLDPTKMQNILTRYYQRFTAQIVHRALMQPASIVSTAAATTTEQRLLVRPLGCHLMTALLAFALVLNISIILMSSKRIYLPPDPSTIAGVENILASSQDVCLRVQDAGNADKKTAF
jgi:hypothetical protein